MDRQSYSFPLDKYFLIHTSKALDLNSSQTDVEDRQGCQNPRFHRHRQEQQELDCDVCLPSQDDQEL